MGIGLLMGLAWSICGILCFVKLDKKYASERIKGIFLGIFFLAFGICGLLGEFIPDDKLSFTALMLPVGLICVLVFIYAWYQVCSCKTPVAAVYLHYNEYYGGKGQHSYAPVFRYAFEGKEYERQTYEGYSRRKIEKLFITGETYQILIDEQNPQSCVTRKKVSLNYYVVFLMGIIFLIAYAGILVTM